MDISYYGIGLFTTNILQTFDLHINKSQALTLNELYQTSLINSFAAVGALCAIFAMKKFTKYRLQTWGFYLSGLALILLAFYGSLYSSSVLLIICFASYNFFINVGPDVTTYLLPSEAYPSEFRATGHAFSAGFAKLGAFLGTLLLPVIQESIKMHGVLLILGCTLILGGFLTKLLPKPNSKMLTNNNNLESSELIITNNEL